MARRSEPCRAQALACGEAQAVAVMALPSSPRDSPFGWCSHNADRPSFNRTVGRIGRP
jgi:hypothetical protein